MKKIIAIILTALLMCSAMPLEVFAEDDTPAVTEQMPALDDGESLVQTREEFTTEDGKLKYRYHFIDVYDKDSSEYDGWSIVNKDEVEILGYAGDENDTDLLIPETIDGKKVVSIYPEAFKNKKYKTVKILGDTNVYWDAFRGCQELETAYMPNVIHIGGRAFYNCPKLTSVKLSDSDTLFVGYKAFDECEKLKNLRFSQLASVEDSAFGFFITNTKKASDIRVVLNESKYVRNNRYISDYYSESESWADDDTEVSPKKPYEISQSAYNGVKCVLKLNSDKSGKIYYPYSGGNFQLSVRGQLITSWCSTNPKVVKITSYRRVRLLQNGKATIKLRLLDGSRITRTIIVDDKKNPSPAIYRYSNDFFFGKPLSKVTVAKGKTTLVSVVGKSRAIKNKYKFDNPKIAKIVEDKKTNTSFIKIKGLKKGTTKLKVTINGVVTRTITVKVI